MSVAKTATRETTGGGVWLGYPWSPADSRSSRTFDALGRLYRNVFRSTLRRRSKEDGSFRWYLVIHRVDTKEDVFEFMLEDPIHGQPYETIETAVAQVLERLDAFAALEAR